MDAQAIYMKLRQKENDMPENKRLSAKEELKATSDALESAWERFNFITDSDLIEAQIYEIRALKSRYSYYLRKLKDHEA